MPLNPSDRARQLPRPPPPGPERARPTAGSSGVGPSGAYVPVPVLKTEDGGATSAETIIAGGLLLLLGGLAAVRIVFYGALWFGVKFHPGVSMNDVVVSLQMGSGEHAPELLVANAIAQALGLGGVAWLAATWRPEGLAWMRLHAASPIAVAVACAGLLGLLPAMQVLGAINTAVLPDSLRAYDAAQHTLFASLLSGEGAFSLVRALVFLALTPALFEELFFRGALLHTWEARGRTWGLIASSVAFSAFHMRPGQVVPLLLIGLYLAFVVQRSGSLRPAIAAHALYNAALIVLATMNAQGGQVPEPGVLSVGSGLGLAIGATVWLRRHIPSPPPILPTDAGVHVP